MLLNMLRSICTVAFGLHSGGALEAASFSVLIHPGQSLKSNHDLEKIELRHSFFIVPQLADAGLRTFPLRWAERLTPLGGGAPCASIQPIQSAHILLLPGLDEDWRRASQPLRPRASGAFVKSLRKAWAVVEHLLAHIVVAVDGATHSPRGG
ncbi:hypothetical protein B0H11DRAFT_2299084 [Mycena galericulata]|nr:hypothetical protein B0H11DRAFT_2299084 [Mycena galericulata]